MLLSACVSSSPSQRCHLITLSEQYLSRPDLFKQIHIHTDVRLALGWTGVLIAGVTALYSYRLEYEKSKPVIWIGLIVYVVSARDHTCRPFTVYASSDTSSSRYRRQFMRISSKGTPSFSENAKLLISGCVAGTCVP